jgi:aromatic-L-amino-acid decarboxylase
MTPDEFRIHAHELVDWMADYMSATEYKVVPPTKPGDVRRLLPGRAPESGESFQTIFEDFRKLIVPNMTHWNHPGWFAYFPANNSPPSILAEMLTATLGAQCMSWQTSPAATELEEVVMAWLADACGLPTTFRGVIQDTASTATLVALITARELHSAGQIGLSGKTEKALRIYASDQAHSSIDKAVKIAGFGLANLVRVPTDSDFAMDPIALRSAILADLAAGHTPCAVCATVGTTSSTAIDPIRKIGEICQEFEVWFHVDAAYAGTATILPELRWVIDGVELADSYVFNPHKWMLTNFDCTAYFVKDPSSLLAAFELTPEYLRTTYDAEVPNFRDWGIQLGRRFRALKLWFVLRSYGVEGIQAMLREHLQMASTLREKVRLSRDFELVTVGVFGLVCLRANPEWAQESELNALNQELMAAVNAEGHSYMTHTRLRDVYTIRVSIGQWRTREEHVDVLWESLNRSLQNLSAGRST